MKEQALDDCLARDRRRLRQRLQRSKSDRQLAQIEAAIERSRQRRAHRATNLPQPEFEQPLPILKKRAEIEQTLHDNQVVVVCGETGSGKSTQLPKMCLAAGRGIDGYIGHTQPRRIAARHIASRIAEELHTGLGDAVGYKIRFGDRIGQDSYIKIVTDGMLLAEVQQDRYLDQYDTLIIDEAHERSLNIDFLLGYLKRLLPKRPDLKLVITSATIDPKSFSRYFGDAPVIEVSGRTYPVELRYRPYDPDDQDRRDRHLQAAVIKAIDKLDQEQPGDVLVFLPGERDIRQLSSLLRKRHYRHTEILPLYARLSAAEQERVFRDHPGRRIVLATNVAETSLTVPRIRYVVDPGYARISRYNPARQVQRLPIEMISQAAADQRKGRCGRVASGVCIRLYSESDYEAQPRFTEPEIMRTSLAAVILKLKGMQLGDIDEFPFLDPPPPRMVNDGYRLLEELTALDSERKLTSLGQQLARLPTDPRIGRMLFAASELGCLSEVLTIAAALEIQDSRDYPEHAQQRAQTLHSRYAHKDSDFLSYLNLWNHFREHTRGMNQRRLRNYCRDNMLSFLRMREWMDVRNQLLEQIREMRLKINTQPATSDAIHRALLSGLLGNIATKYERHEYQGTRGKRLYIHPSSQLFKAAPKWIMAAELVETDRLYARTIATINPEWVEPFAKYLLQRSYLEPHWEQQSGQVIASQQVSLFGLVVISQRKVHFGPIDPNQAREIFIREGLITGELGLTTGFLDHNQRLIDQIEDLENKSRRRDVLINEEQMFQYYDQRIPNDICARPAFQAWLQRAQREDPKVLHMDQKDLMAHDAEHITLARFPDHMEVAGNALPLRYHFAPGHLNDGVTVTVPLPLLSQLPEALFTWLVPGLLHEKITALIRSLPKSLRVHFAPAPDTARRCVETLEHHDEDLYQALAGCLYQLTGTQVKVKDWDLTKLPAHLHMNFEAVDSKGQVLATDRNLSRLREVVTDTSSAPTTDAPRLDIERRGITAWDFDSLPSSMDYQQHGVSLTGYPAVVDQGESVAIEAFDRQDAARAAMQSGIRRLLMLSMPQQAKYLRKNLPGIDRLCLYFANMGACDALKQDLIDACFDRTLTQDAAAIRDRTSFQAQCDITRNQVMSVANDLCAQTDTVLTVYHDIVDALQCDGADTEADADIRDQLALLVHPGFIAATPSQWLAHYPRYLKGIQVRMDRLRHGGGHKDRSRLQDLQPHWQRLITHWPNHVSEAVPELAHYRWMLEEYRISLFAQELRTALPVSSKRLAQQWDTVMPALGM